MKRGSLAARSIVPPAAIVEDDGRPTHPGTVVLLYVDVATPTAVQRRRVVLSAEQTDVLLYIMGTAATPLLVVQRPEVHGPGPRAPIG